VPGLYILLWEMNAGTRRVTQNDMVGSAIPAEVSSVAKGSSPSGGDSVEHGGTRVVSGLQRL
jgi:hypothetical protein